MTRPHSSDCWIIAWLVATVPQAWAGPVDDTAPTARQFLLAGKYAEAEEAYTQLAADQPVAAALGIARCHAAVGKLDEAAATLTAALDKQPDAADLHAQLAELAFERGEYAIAREAVDAALRLASDSFGARWIDAELLRAAGRLDEADAAYQWFVDYYNGHDVTSPEALRFVGLAAAQFARWHRLTKQFSFLVNELYPDALKLDKGYWPAHYETGLLFLEKYNQAEAARALKHAQQLNPNAAEVYAALAALALQNYQLDDARRLIERSFELNPRLAAAHRARADLLLANFEAAKAVEVLEAAVPLNPVAEETLGRLAAAYVVVDGLPDDLAGTRFGKLLAEVDNCNPRAGEFYFALATALDTSRRFPAAARYYREAVERMPQLTAPRGALGLMYMRLGDEAEAKRLLDESFAVDPFNIRVDNSLKVLEVLDGYAIIETKHFAIKFDRGHDELLARYAADYLESVYPKLVEHFDFEPEAKSLFEIFSKARNTNGHGWFSARMVGLPYIGTVGACAGKMVALASPNDMPKKYNWARVLKHEFVHVLNLQQTRYNIPHWFTEALAVESEGLPRPQAWNDLLAERVPKGELLNLDTINLGFIRPKSGLDWQMAYCQAQLYAQYMCTTFGEDALAKMLAAFRDNLDTTAALKRAFGVDQAAFEQGYLEFVRGVVAGLSRQVKSAPMTLAQLQRAAADDPDNPDVLAMLARAHLDRKDYAQARKLAEKAKEKQPKHALAGYVLARERLVVGETEEAIALLEASLDRESPQEDVLRALAALRFKAEQYEEAEKLYLLGAKLEPADGQWTKALARVYLTTGEDAKLAPLLTNLAEHDADDPTVRKKLAQMALKGGDYAAAVRWANQANQIDVMDADIHRIWAEALAGGGDFAAAIGEYEVAVGLKPDEPAWRLALARACVEAEQPAKARQVVAALLKTDPDYPGAQALAETLKP
jgi:tetratricopeptide (TPR) repeat protein